MNVNEQQMNGSRQSRLPERSDRLNSWKQIAVYLDREVRTVQRWEKREGLPIHRHLHMKAATVYAYKNEVDAWFKNRCQALIKPVPEKQHSDQFVDWSNPTLLVARQKGNICWLWLVVAPRSHRLDRDSSVVTIDEKADVGKALTIKRNSSARRKHDNP